MAVAGLTLFSIGGIAAVSFLVATQWERGIPKPTLFFLWLGVAGASGLMLLGGILFLYARLVWGGPLPAINLSELSPQLLIGVALGLSGLWFWAQGGIVNRGIALICGYTVLMFCGLVPDLSGSPLVPLGLILLTALRWLAWV